MSPIFPGPRPLGRQLADAVVPPAGSHSTQQPCEDSLVMSCPGDLADRERTWNLNEALQPPRPPPPAGPRTPSSS